jgi:hypothetical protein
MQQEDGQDRLHPRAFEVDALVADPDLERSEDAESNRCGHAFPRGWEGASLSEARRRREGTFGPLVALWRAFSGHRQDAATSPGPVRAGHRRCVEMVSRIRRIAIALGSLLTVALAGGAHWKV